MVALVVVAHSQTLADGVCQMAAEMAHGRVGILAAGGVAESDALGTDATRILAAIRSLAANPECDGILILADLGSAILSAETALDLLTAERHPPIRISQAPLAEGTVAAAVAAAAGKSLAEVEAEACAAGAAKLGTPPVQAEPSPSPEAADEIRLEAVLGHAHGLHARPAAALVACAAGYGAKVRLRDLTSGSAWVDGTSLTQLVMLGSNQGDRLELAVSGARAAEAAAALRRVVTEAEAEGRPIATPAQSERAAPGRGFRGIPSSAGIAVGPVRRLVAARLVVRRRTSQDPRAEIEQMREARQAAQTDLDNLVRCARDAGRQIQAELLSAQSVLLDDPALVQAAEARVVQDGASAEVAWELAIDDAARGFEAHPDEYVRARAADVRDAGQRVLGHLLGASEPMPILGEPGILVAEDLSPSQLVELDPRSVLGICTAGGSPNSHAAILARALLIPAVVGCGKGILALMDGAQVVLDGDQGTLAPEPTGARGAPADARRTAARKAGLAHLEQAHLPAVTQDGRRIEVAANIGSLAEAQALSKYGAEGVGVLRTEFLYLGRQQPPDEEEQVRIYLEILRACGGKPMIARTLDVGGDKRLPYIGNVEEQNPFLGMRGLRLSLDMPDLFRCQLRALLRAGVEPGLQVMFPMVTTLAEVEQARQLLGEARADLRRRGLPHAARLPLGMMVEVPAAALMAERFAGEVDFMSIGTNDLAQYTQAAERTNPRMVGLGDSASPAVLRLIAHVVQACRDAGILAGVCGEMAADPVLLPILIGLGVDELSMTAPAIPRTKALIRALVWEDARRLADRALHAASAAEVRTLAANPALGPA